MSIYPDHFSCLRTGATLDDRAFTEARAALRAMRLGGGMGVEDALAAIVTTSIVIVELEHGPARAEEVTRLLLGYLLGSPGIGGEDRI